MAGGREATAAPTKKPFQSGCLEASVGLVAAGSLAPAGSGFMCQSGKKYQTLSALIQCSSTGIVAPCGELTPCIGTSTSTSIVTVQVSAWQEWPPFCAFFQRTVVSFMRAAYLS